MKAVSHDLMTGVISFFFFFLFALASCSKDSEAAM